MDRQEFFAKAKVGSKLKLREDLEHGFNYGKEIWIEKSMYKSIVVTVLSLEQDFFTIKESAILYHYSPEMVEYIFEDEKLPIKVKFIEQSTGTRKIKICPVCEFTIPKAYKHAYENEWCPECGLNLEER